MNSLQIVYKDEHIVVVIKPGGLLSVPGRRPEHQDCVSSRLQAIIPTMIAQPAVHRLDMYTSGLMVYAVTKAAHRNLSIQFEQQQVHKKYIALLEGLLDEDSGEITLPFRLDIDNRPIQIYDPIHGKIGITQWKTLQVEANTTRVEFTPLTGKTHQLRVHAAHPKGLNTPIIGDSFYGTGKDGDKMMLHASALQFTHPATAQPLSYSAAPDF